MNIFVKYWKYLLMIIIGIFIGLMINFPSCKNDSTTVYIPVHDTLVVDSVRIQEKTKTIYTDRIDTFYLTETDTVYIKNLPIEYKNYKDTIITDSSSTEINIDYHGFSSGIDNIYLQHHYYNKHTVVPEKKKNVSPFLFLEAGPQFYKPFNNVNGLVFGAGGGIYIKDRWGLGASYNISTDLDHTIKLQLYRKF